MFLFLVTSQMTFLKVYGSECEYLEWAIMQIFFCKNIPQELLGGEFLG